MIKKVLLKAVTVILIASFSFDTACYGLATLPASQNPAAKLEISAALRRTQIRHAESDDAVRLLRTNNASCLLLSSGKYLVAKEVAGDDLKLLRAIIHEDIEAVMQILAKEDRYKYLGIKELILRRFPPAKENNLPIELFVNHTVARAFEWLVLTRQGMILRGDIPESERSFIEAIEPMINANRHNYFTAEFWDSRTSGERIRSALNRGLRFYRVASSHSKGRDSFRGGYRGVEPDEYSARISVTQEERAKITEFQKDNLWKYVGEGFRFLDMGTDLKEAVYFRDDHDRMAAVRIGDRIGIDSDLALIAPPFNPENPDSKVFQTLVNDMMDPDGVGYCIPYLVRGNDRRLAEDYLERNIDRFTEFLAAAQHFNIKINDLSGMEDLLRADLIKAAGDYPIPDKCRYDIIPAIYPVILRYSGSFGSLRKLTTGLARRRLPFWQILKFGVPFADNLANRDVHIFEECLYALDDVAKDLCDMGSDIEAVFKQAEDKKISGLMQNPNMVGRYLELVGRLTRLYKSIRDHGYMDNGFKEDVNALIDKKVLQNLDDLDEFIRLEERLLCLLIEERTIVESETVGYTNCESLDRDLEAAKQEYELSEASPPGWVYSIDYASDGWPEYTPTAVIYNYKIILTKRGDVAIPSSVTRRLFESAGNDLRMTMDLVRRLNSLDNLSLITECERLNLLGQAPQPQSAKSGEDALPARSMKCLVLDCDGVLWQGVVGEDGMRGIRVTLAHMLFQKRVKALKDRGIILAINSKNNPGDVEEVLDKYPDMILRKGDFAIIRANWQDKASNLREIARELNIGLDSLVFLDDSVHERELARMTCPEVSTPDFPEDTIKRISIVDGLSASAQGSVTDEDRRRTELYAAYEGRENLKKRASSLDDYYHDLGMIAVIRQGGENLNYIARMAQLIQRTNQFNLTLKRYTEEDLRRLMAQHDERGLNVYRIYSVQLIDKFGDNGIVGVIILDCSNPDEVSVDTFCLSCRAVGLTLEDAFLAYTLPVPTNPFYRTTRKGLFRKGNRNAFAEGVYPRLGFKKAGTSGEGVVWELEADTEIKPSKWVYILPWKDYQDKYNETRGREVSGLLKAAHDMNDQQLAEKILQLAKERGLEDSILKQSIGDIFTLLDKAEVRRKALELELVYLGLDEKILKAEGGGIRKVIIGCRHFDKYLEGLLRQGKKVLSTDVIDDTYEGYGGNFTVTHEITYIESEADATIEKAAVPLFPYFRMRNRLRFFGQKIIPDIETWVIRTHKLCIECGLFNLLEPRKLAGGYYPGTTDPLPEDESRFSPWLFYHKGHSAMNIDLEITVSWFSQDEWDSYVANLKRYRDSLLGVGDRASAGGGGPTRQSSSGSDGGGDIIRALRTNGPSEGLRGDNEADACYITRLVRETHYVSLKRAFGNDSADECMGIISGIAAEFKRKGFDTETIYERILDPALKSLQGFKNVNSVADFKRGMLAARKLAVFFLNAEEGKLFSGAIEDVYKVLFVDGEKDYSIHFEPEYIEKTYGYDPETGFDSLRFGDYHPPQISIIGISKRGTSDYAYLELPSYGRNLMWWDAGDLKAQRTDKDFRCKKGTCVKCCERFPIVITIPDIFRIWSYLRSKGINKTIGEVFAEISDGWLVQPGIGCVYVVPKAKEPCPFIDHEKKMCLIHAARFLSCATFPETALAVRPYGIDVKNRQLEYMRSRGISCVDGVKMSGPRREYVERLGEALYEEVAFTGQVLDSAIADEDLRFARSSDDVRRYFENSGMKEKALAVIKGMDDPDSRGELYQKVLPFLKKYAMLDIGDFAGEEEASVGSRDRSSSSGQWQVGEPDLYDAQGATFLLSDLIYTQLHSDRMYTIQYDASRLSPSQADVIREYVKLLRKRSSNPANIALRPFSSARGSQKSLISAYCSGENFSGEGHVIVPQEEIEKYLLRITGMLNMALAVSNVPDNLAKEDLDRYMPVISYIRGQYTAILGEELVMPDNPEGILKAIRRITLGLPKSMRMEPSRIEEYNRLAKEALAAA